MRALWCLFTTRTGFLCFFCQCECIVWCADNLDSAVCTTTLITEARLDRCRLLLPYFCVGSRRSICRVLFAWPFASWLSLLLFHIQTNKTPFYAPLTQTHYYHVVSFFDFIFNCFISLRMIEGSRVPRMRHVDVSSNHFHQSHFVLLPIFDRFHCSNRIHSSHAECLELLPFAKWHVYDTWLLPYGKQCAYVCNAMAFVSVHFRNEKQSNWM